MQDTNNSINNKGFTLVELLATIAILAIIMLLAIPNIVGVVQRSRNKTYIEDAKKLVALAKYRIKTDSDLKREIDYGSICLYKSYLDKGNEINDAPNGGTYSKMSSFVEVTKNQYDGTYTYKVQLVESSSKNSGENLQGLKAISSEDLAKDNAYKSITNGYTDSCNGTNKY